MEKREEKYAGLAVLVIDMQPAYLADLDRATRLRLIQNQVEVVSYYDRKNVPVIGVELEEQGRTIPILRKYFKEKPVRKWSRDGFFKTNLADKVRKTRSTTLIMMGIFRSECVYTTAETALALDFKVYTASSLIADYSKIEIDGYPVTDDELRLICSLSANNQELFSMIKQRKSSKD